MSLKEEIKNPTDEQRRVKEISKIAKAAENEAHLEQRKVTKYRTVGTIFLPFALLAALGFGLYTARNQIEDIYRYIHSHMFSTNATPPVTEPVKKRLTAQDLEARLNEGKGHFDLGVHFEKLGDQDAALEEYELAVEYNPNDIFAHQNLAQIYSDKKELDKAKSALETAIKISQKFGQAHNTWGEYALGLADIDSAKKDFTRAIKFDPNIIDAYLRLANIHAIKKEFTKATSLLKKANSIDINNDIVHNNLGYYLELSGDLDSAEKHYNLALKFNPESKTTYFNLGRLYKDKKQFKKAKKVMQKAIDIDPKLIYAHDSLGEILKELGDAKSAMNAYEQSLKLNPNNVFGLISLADLYGKAKQYQKAATLLEKAIQLEPKSALAHNNLGLYLNSMMDYNSAERELKLAVEFAPKNEIIKENLEIILKQNTNRRKKLKNN